MSQIANQFYSDSSISLWALNDLLRHLLRCFASQAPDGLELTKSSKSQHELVVFLFEKHIRTEHDAHKGKPCFPHKDAEVSSPSSVRLHGAKEDRRLASLPFSHQERMPRACILHPTRGTKCSLDAYQHRLITVGGGGMLARCDG